jgi:phosphotransferase system HPr (HPr) family protein
MTSRLVTVRCPQGLHLRVASSIVKIAQASAATVRVGCEGCPQANACSPLQLLMLGATAGTTLEIAAEGPGEDAVLAALADVFEQGGGI